MRCLTLADELVRQGHECQFICREHEGHLGELITSKGYKLTLLSSRNDNELGATNGNSDSYALWLGLPWQEDAKETFDTLKPHKLDWLVVDHYALDAKWERYLAKTVSNIMVIDDLANRPHECMLLLDQNLGRDVSDYDKLLSADCQRLIGPRYALLRREFAEIREQSLSRRKRPKLKRILISLGGVDRTNVTGQILEELAKSTLPATTELDIIMGSAAPYLYEVQQQLTYLPFSATVNVGVNDMAHRMYLADLSIGAAGGTSWERCCLGLPAVLVVLAENQVAGGMALEASGAASVIGDTAQIETTLLSLLGSLSDSNRLKKMSNAAANITDGRGIFEVVKSMSSAGRVG